MIKKILSFFTRNKWRKIFGVILFTPFLLIGGLIVIFMILGIKDKYVESIIDKKFHSEASQIPQIKVKFFNLWERNAIVHADIKNKGLVIFWYGQDGVPRIESIKDYKYDTSFDCIYIDNKGNKLGYAYEIGLSLDGNTSLYRKWFPFQVNNLQDLVDKYDEIIRVLDTFPKDPEMVELEGKTWNKLQVVKNPNPDFTLKDKHNGKDIACDLYITTTTP